MFAWLAVLLLVVIAVLALAAFFSSSVVKPYVGRTVNNDLQGQIGASVPKITPPASTGSSGAGQLVITQQQINDEIAKNAGSFGPLSSVAVQIEDGQFIVNFSAYGMTGKYQGHVEMQNGQPVVTGGHVSGMLGWFVPTDQIETAFNREIAAAVAKAGVQVSSVDLRPGEMVLNVTS